MCRDVVRYLALGGIVLLSGGLIIRDFGRQRVDGCAKTGAAVRLPQQHLACRDCAALVECPLPAAAAARKRGRR
jgi:hypothetical protein